MHSLYKPLANDTTMGKRNLILSIQDKIRLECERIIESQAKEEDLKLYTEHQALLNILFVKHMDLGIIALRRKIFSVHH